MSPFGSRNSDWRVSLLPPWCKVPCIGVKKFLSNLSWLSTLVVDHLEKLTLDFNVIGWENRRKTCYKLDSIAVKTGTSYIGHFSFWSFYWQNFFFFSLYAYPTFSSTTWKHVNPIKLLFHKLERYFVRVMLRGQPRQLGFFTPDLMETRKYIGRS